MNRFPSFFCFNVIAQEGQKQHKTTALANDVHKIYKNNVIWEWRNYIAAYVQHDWIWFSNSAVK